MRVNRQQRRIARILWQDSFVDGAPDPAALRRALETLRDDRRRDEGQILTALLDRIAPYLRDNRLRISSAEALPEERRRQLLSVIGNSARFTGGIEFAVNPALIAGLRIERGYEVEDHSVAKRLETLRVGLLKN